MKLKFPTPLAAALFLVTTACAPSPGSEGAPPAPASNPPSAGAGTGGSAPPAPAPGTGGAAPSAPPVTGTGGAAPTPPPAPDAASPPAPDTATPSSPRATEPGDTPPDRPLMVDVARPQVFTFKFKPSEADPAASRRDETQTASVDTGAKPHRGKLVVTLSGVGGGPGPLNLVGFAAGLGFHAFAVAYENSVNPSGQSDPKFFGNMRYEQFDGMDRTPAITVSRADSVEVRVGKALAYLQMKNPAGDWAYFLDKSGGVRWSDVIFIGHSHGATSAAAYAKLRRVWRAISLAGPRDTRPVTATWFADPSATPLDRYYAFTGAGDGQHGDHIKAMDAMKYIGALTEVAGATPPFGGTHRLKSTGGHGDPADCDGKHREVCKYMMGVE